MNNDTIDQRLSKSRTGWDYTRVSRIQGKKVIRSVIHIDAYYSFQSHATVSLWTPNGWTEVSTHPGEELTAYYTFPSIHVTKETDENALEDFSDAANVLEAPALHYVLDGAS